MLRSEISREYSNCIYNIIRKYQIILLMSYSTLVSQCIGFLLLQSLPKYIFRFVGGGNNYPNEHEEKLSLVTCDGLTAGSCSLNIKLIDISISYIKWHTVFIHIYPLKYFISRLSYLKLQCKGISI